jgi:hypothetical protein
MQSSFGRTYHGPDIRCILHPRRPPSPSSPFFEKIEDGSGPCHARRHCWDDPSGRPVPSRQCFFESVLEREPMAGRWSTLALMRRSRGPHSVAWCDFLVPWATMTVGWCLKTNLISAYPVYPHSSTLLQPHSTRPESRA